MEQPTNALRKLVRSLGVSRHRRENGLFVAEGAKCVADTAGHFPCRYLIARTSWLEDNQITIDKIKADNILQASAADMDRMTNLSTPPQVMAVYDIPDEPKFDQSTADSHLIVALDRVQDPGNLGTIVRLCDWMGVTTILASADTADIWSPKAVQSTMGAISRVSVIYCDLPAVLASCSAPVYGTFLNAPSIYSTPLTSNGIVIFGNEGQGISDAVAATVNRRLLIPSFPPERPTSESLNVATAAAITLSEFRSRQLKSRN